MSDAKMWHLVGRFATLESVGDLCGPIALALTCLCSSYFSLYLLSPQNTSIIGLQAPPEGDQVRVCIF